MRPKKPRTDKTLKWEFDPSIPTYDWLGDKDLSSPAVLHELIDNFIYDLQQNQFVAWEAVVADEQGLPLSKGQKQILSGLLSFNDDDDPILYIDEMPRPKQPWYEILRRIAEILLVEPLDLDGPYFTFMDDGWADILQAIEDYGEGLSLPSGVIKPIEVVPSDLRHKLNLQSVLLELSCFRDAEEQNNKHEEIVLIVELMRRFVDSIEFFDLSLESFLGRIIMTEQDRTAVTDAIKMELGIESANEELGPLLRAREPLMVNKP